MQLVVQSLSRVSLRPRGLEPTRLLCPWDFPGEDTGGDCRLLQGTFPTQGLNPSLLRCRWVLYYRASREAPRVAHDYFNGLCCLGCLLLNEVQG